MTKPSRPIEIGEYATVGLHQLILNHERYGDILFEESKGGIDCRKKRIKPSVREQIADLALQQFSSPEAFVTQVVSDILQAIFPLPELSDGEAAEAYRDYKQAKGYRDWWDINEARALSVTQAQLAKVKEHIEKVLKE